MALRRSYPTPATGLARRVSNLASSGTSQLICGIDPDRLELIITNDGAAPVWLALQTVEGTDPVAIAGKGMRLNEQGGAYVTNCFTGKVAVISAGGAENICVTEV